MTSRRIRAFVVLAMMLAAAALAQAWRPTARLADSRPPVVLEELFPKQFGAWAIDERTPAQIVSPDIQAFIEKIYNQTLSRVYVNSTGQRVMLTVAYGGDQSDATRAHRPEVCYPAQGFQIMSSATALLTLGPQALRVRQLVAKQGGRWEPITYWIMVGSKVALSGTEQKLAQLEYSTGGTIPDGMLVRTSTIDNDSAQAFAVQADFIAQMAAAIDVGARSQIVGSR